jgi:FkbH-like protein
MIFPRLSEIEESLAQPNIGLQGYSCAVLRNITLEGIESYLRFAARRSGLELDIAWGDFDNILQEAKGGGSAVVGEQTQAILVYLWLPAFSEILSSQYAASSDVQIDNEVARLRAYCSATVAAIRERSKAAILWYSFEAPAWPAYGILDRSCPDIKLSQRNTIAALNAYLQQELTSAGNGWLIDTGQCVERVGTNQFYDWRYWYIARAPFTRIALAELAVESAKHLRALTGKVRKCLVLDCDNTLWGGIIGEDGIKGIHIGIEHPGSAYRTFQHQILNLYHRGVILALCSKNNLSDVLEVLRERSEMILREEHFSVMRINWQDKASNLREIAAELNIGLDSLVFADDSAFEINLIRSTLPEVETILINSNKPYDSSSLLAACGWFDTHTLTAEDRKRGQMYRAEAARQSLLGQSLDMSDYLASLEMRLCLETVKSESEFARAEQLCQRTNQFNLTTKRYTHAELASFAGVPGNSLFLLKLSDRFGEYGVVGLCLILKNGKEAIIDSFLMSCRALGREAESAFLALCLNRAAAKGAQLFKACYVASKKNAQVANFYTRNGFEPLGAKDIEESSPNWFELAWQPNCIEIPKHFMIENNDGDI